MEQDGWKKRKDKKFITKRQEGTLVSVVHLDPPTIYIQMKEARMSDAITVLDATDYFVCHTKPTEEERELYFLENGIDYPPQDLLDQLYKGE